MALSNVVLLSQIAGYIIALILSLCVIVPMSLHQDDFRLGRLLREISTRDYCEFQGALLIVLIGGLEGD